MLVDEYNRDANGIELSRHGIEEQLDQSEAAKMREFANTIIQKINLFFNEPVCKPIGDSWYQVPSQFRIAETDSYDGQTKTFTISHHDCGLHEFDFIVRDKIGEVVAYRYDSLEIDW